MTSTMLNRLDWDTFADATFTRDERARQLGRELAATVTPPIVLARKARHRHPCRHPHAIRKALRALIVLAAIFTAIGTARSVPTAPAFYGITPSQASHLATVLEAPGYQLTADTAPANWPELTCAAFGHYMRGDRRPALERLETAYRHLQRGYLRTDVFWLLHDVKHHRDTGLAVQYLWEDCSNGAGL